MPEGGAERDVTWLVHHNCGPAKALKGPLEDPDIDVLLFPIGLEGEGMPANTPFDVTCTEPCGACGALVGAWFEWSAPKLFLPA